MVLNGAQVAEYGTHDELMARGGRYAELYGIQAASYHAGYQTTGNPEEAGDLDSL
jgi:ATP-binding cassette subfamily B protein